MQTTDTLLMVRPVNFRKNEQTAVNNHFQEDINTENAKINLRAQVEFDNFVTVLRDKGIRVIVVEDTPEPNTPDAVFPNNRMSFHADGTVCIFPMYADNRRKERALDIFSVLKDGGFVVNNLADYTEAESEQRFLEGTGSMILDRENKIAYCALSERSDKALFLRFCADFDYVPVTFTANQTVNGMRTAIYHTNVMMSIAERFAIICLDCIDDSDERENVVEHLYKAGKSIIPITEQQVYRFAGNMLQVKNTDDRPYLVMSATAAYSLTSQQIVMIQEHCDIVHSDLDTIETCGGGSARCMMAEVFLPEKETII